MFTGLIQAVAPEFWRIGDRLSVSYPAEAWDTPFLTGESVAVNGCCLTVVADENSRLDFDVSEETWNRTALGTLEQFAVINLERAIRPIDRFGGHIVQGHVDGIGKIMMIEERETSTRIRIQIPEQGEKYLIDKGSIAIDGVSLTVVKPIGREFEVWVIPHTLASTNLGSAGAGDNVNVEYDVLAKHVEKLMASRA